MSRSRKFVEDVVIITLISNIDGPLQSYAFSKCSVFAILFFILRSELPNISIITCIYVVSLSSCNVLLFLIQYKLCFFLLDLTLGLQYGLNSNNIFNYLPEHQTSIYIIKHNVSADPTNFKMSGE